MKRRSFYLFAAVLLAGLTFFAFNISWIGEPLREAASSRIKSKGKGKGLTQLSPMSSPSKSPLEAHKPKQTEKVHIFYYPWYSNPEKDSVHAWNHWNHNILPHWNEGTRQKYPYDIKYVPPDDIGSCFFPKRGPYASADPDLIRDHFTELSDYAIIVSWWGRGKTDGEGMNTNDLMDILFNIAEELDVELGFHIEPYPGRSAATVREDLEYIFEKWGKSRALYRDPKRGNLPVIYMYDSYQTSSYEWSTILKKDGPRTIRGTEIDAVVLGLWVESGHSDLIAGGHFDGFYTYFASDVFVYGSSPRNWPIMAQKAREHNWAFSISVGPGYDDTRIRPWNAQNTRRRDQGRYYDNMWKSALEVNPSYVSITSYNEWMEGTQIEAAVPKSISKTIYNNQPYTYQDYQPLEPNYYIQKTHEWTAKFIQQRK